MALSRDSVGAIAIALLAVLGMGLVAATLTTTYTTQFTASGPGQGTAGDGANFGGAVPGETRNDSGNGSFGRAETQRPMSLPEICIPILTDPAVILGIVAAFALIVAMAYRQFELLGAAFSIYLVGLPITVAYALATQCPSPSGGPASSPVRRVASQIGGSGQVTSTPVPPVLLAGLFGVAAIGAVVMLLSASGDETVEPPSDLMGDEELNLSEFAAAAGEAADRIEASQASVDNSVYRAWREMTELLEVGEPQATTAGEFAEAAIEAGLAREDVEELTRLFDEVRHGEMDPEPREELALETLRNIESTYSGELGDEEGEQ